MVQQSLIDSRLSPSNQLMSPIHQTRNKASVIILVLIVLLGTLTATEISGKSKRVLGVEDEMVLMVQVTRHGARSPISELQGFEIQAERSGEYSENGEFGGLESINTEPWTDGLGELTASGERQHYLLGSKHRKKFIEDDVSLLSKDFDPKEIHITSTPFNRTIMSAYSENKGWYPLGSVEKLSSEENKEALPPFEIKDKDKIIKNLGNDPTKHGYQPIPIHVGGDEFNQMFRAYSSSVCPVAKKFEQRVKEEAKFIEINERYR